MVGLPWTKRVARRREAALGTACNSSTAMGVLSTRARAGELCVPVGGGCGGRRCATPPADTAGVHFGVVPVPGAATVLFWAGVFAHSSNRAVLGWCMRIQQQPYRFAVVSVAVLVLVFFITTE